MNHRYRRQGSILLVLSFALFPFLLGAANGAPAPMFIDPVPGDVTIDCFADLPPKVNLRSVNMAGDTSINVPVDSIVPMSDILCEGGTVFRIWTATGDGQTLRAIQEITVQAATEGPTINAPLANITVDCRIATAQPSNADYYQNWLQARRLSVALGTSAGCAPIVSSTDNAPPDINGFDCNDALTIIFTVTDDCGFMTQRMVTYSVFDGTPPQFVNPPQNTVIACDAPIPAAVDPQVVDCTRQLTRTFTETSNQPTNAVGCASIEYQITRTWTYTDSCNLSSTLVQTISIEDNQAPTFSVPPFRMIDCTQDPQNLAITLEPSNLMDNCTAVADLNVSYTDMIVGNSDCAQSYMIRRTWAVRDLCDNTSVQIQQINVFDNQAPNGFGPGPITVECQDADEPSITGTPTDLTDNCDATVGMDFTDVIQPGSCANNYVIQRTWRIFDDCNNSRTFPQTITVIDTTAPVFSTPPSNLILTCENELDQFVAYNNWITSLGGAVATDNCTPGNAIVYNFYVSGTTDEPTFPDLICTMNGYIRALDVDVVAEDECGNQTVATMIYRQGDPNAPDLFDCPANRTVGTDEGTCDYNAALPPPRIRDRCVTGLTLLHVTRDTLPITSQAAPGEEGSTPVDEILFNFPINVELPAIAFNITRLTIRLDNVDAEGPDEFFRIFGEDGALLGTTAPADTQCGTSITVIDTALTRLQFDQYAVDGMIKIRLVPNVPAGQSGAFAVNALCAGGSTAIGELRTPIRRSSPIFYDIGIDNRPRVAVSPIDTFRTTLEQGFHLITYYATDCNGNVDSCSHTITVEDSEPPQVVCPPNVSVIAAADSCSARIRVPLPVAATDNCGLAMETSVTLPADTAGALLTYALDPNLNRYQAQNKDIVFPNLPANAFGTVTIRADFRGDFATNQATFDLLLNGDNALSASSVGDATCTAPGTYVRTIPATTFNALAQTNNFTVTFRPRAITVPPGTPGDGINPCTPVTTNGGNDGSSYVFITITYNTLQPSYFAGGATTVPLTTPGTQAGQPDLEFAVGITDFSYTLTDLAGNADTCNLIVEVRDTTLPTVLVQPTTVFIDPSGLLSQTIDPSVIDAGSTDNCTIDTTFLTPATFNCSQFNTTQPVTLTVRDVNGNESTAGTFVSVQPLQPQPTANSGLCGGDTLFLFANPPTPTVPGQVVYTFRWFGPNGNLISTVENPVIPGISEANEGAYRVEILGLTGCMAENTVNVTIQDLPISPQLSAPMAVCTGTPIPLTSTSNFAGTVVYQWYEGVAPTGTLLASTAQAEYMVPPPHGNAGRRFYLRVLVNGCESTASQGLTVTTTVQPTAATVANTLSGCEGTSLVLAAQTVPGANIAYQWTGPNNYTSNNQFAELGPLQNFSSGFYYLRVVSGGGCFSAPDSVLVNVLPAPAQPQLSNDGPVCLGSPLTLTSSATGGSSYTFIAPSGEETVRMVPNLTIPTATAATAGTWRLFTTVNGCVSPTSMPTQVVVNQLPTADAVSAPNPICEGNDLILQGSSNTAGSQYAWSGPNGFTSNQVSPIIPNVTAAAGGNYTLQVTSPSGCTTSRTLAVNVRPGLRVLGINSNAPSCLNGGETVALTATVFPLDSADTYTYQWTGPSGMSSQDSFMIPNVTQAAIGNYTVVATNPEGCTSPPRTFTLDLNFAPARPTMPATLSGATNFCTGDSFTLTPNDYGAGVTYFWELPGGSIINTTEPMVTLTGFAPGGSGTYRVRVVRQGCSSPFSLPRNLTVNTFPVITATSNTPICAGGVIQLQATNLPGATYVWQGPNGFSSSLPNPTINTADAALHNGTYRVVARNNGCSSDTMLVEVVVNPRPTAPVGNVAGPICLDQPGALINLSVVSNSATPGAAYQWFAADGVTPVSPLTPSLEFGLTDFTLFGQSGNYNFFVRADLNGCTSPLSGAASVRLDRIPADVATIGPDTTVCAGVFVLIAQQPGTAAGRWTRVGGDSTAFITAPQSSTTAITGMTVAGSPYTFRWSLSNGSCQNYSTDEITVTVTAAETAQAGENILVCANTAVQLAAVAPTGTGSSGQWTQPLAQEILGVVIANPDDPQTAVTGLQPDNVYSFNWTVSSLCGNSTDVVLVNISDPAPDAGPDVIACDLSAAATVTAAAPSVGSIGRWSSPDAAVVIANPANRSTQVSNLAVGENLLVWTVDQGLCGPGARDTTVVLYKEPPLAVADVVLVPFGVTTSFDPTVNDEVPPGSTVNFPTVPSRGRVEADGQGGFQFVPPANFVGTISVFYELQSAGCTTVNALIDFQVGQSAQCTPPNIFTPNNDDINDAFVIPCLLDEGRFPQSQVRIFNQWGDEVYVSGIPYDNDWRGTYDGEELPAGTYFYVVDPGDGSVPLEGYVLIQR
ncbi:MAG: gliding motility-associated C-terminal domain-containing protein [Saprospiraceae bacterium]